MMLRSWGISPGTLAPASTTSASASSGASRSVSGTPTRLLRLAEVACTRHFVPSAARIISFVLVFPLDPVIAMTGLCDGSSRRRARASIPSASSVSGTSKNGSPSTGGVPRRTTAAAAPRPFASGRKSCASNRSPLSATNSAPGVRCRVSVLTPVNRNPRGPETPSVTLTESQAQTVTAPPQNAERGMWNAEQQGKVPSPKPAPVRDAGTVCSACRIPRSALARPQLPHHLPLVERALLGADHLIGLVPFPGEEHGVVALREAQRERDRRAAIGDAVMRRGPHSGLNLVEDVHRVLPPRIVGGGDGDVGEPGR